jgi:hypothetical protein
MVTDSRAEAQDTMVENEVEDQLQLPRTSILCEAAEHRLIGIPRQSKFDDERMIAHQKLRSRCLRGAGTICQSSR